MKKFFVIALALLSGCALHETFNTGRFEIIEDDTFIYHVPAQPVEMKDEDTRMQWLTEHLALNEMCEQGFVILKRQPTAIRQTLAGKRYRIAYYGRCKD